MALEIREKIVVLTSEKWVDKHEIANQIANSYQKTKGTIIHYSSLRKKLIKKLGSDYTKEKLDVRMLEHVSRAISATLLSGTYLVLDIDIADIPSFNTLLRTIEQVAMLISDMKDECDDISTKGDYPIRIFHLSVSSNDDEQEAYVDRCYAEYMEELYQNMGSEAKILADLLKKELEANIEHERLAYIGLVFNKYYTFSPLLRIKDYTILKESELKIENSL